MTTVILGGAGRSGSRILDRLTTASRPVRPAARRTGSDWDDITTWRGALRGATAAYVCFTPDPASPGVPEKMETLGGPAAAEDLERLVLLSGRGEEGARASEPALRGGGVPTTVLRCSWFQQNFSEHLLAGPARRGRLRLPVPDVPEAFVDLDDVADAAVVALIRAVPEDATYELPGPDLLTFAEAAMVIAEACHRTVAFEAVDVPVFLSCLAADGVLAKEAEPFAYLFSEILDGRDASLAHGVRHLLGCPASGFRSYARRTAEAGA